MSIDTKKTLTVKLALLDVNSAFSFSLSCLNLNLFLVFISRDCFVCQTVFIVVQHVKKTLQYKKRNDNGYNMIIVTLQYDNLIYIIG